MAIGKLYGRVFLSAFNKEIDLDSDTLKLMLCTSTYVPAQDTHRYKSDVTNEIVGTGYTAGGVALTSVTVTYDAATNTMKLDAADPSWPSGSTFTFRYAVLYDSTPATDATRPLIGYIDYETDQSVAGEPLTLVVSTSGVATFPVV